MKQAAPAWSLSPWPSAWRVWILLVVLASPLSAADVTMEGNVYRPLADVAALYGMKVDWVTPGQTLQAQNQYCAILVTASERIVRLNDEAMALGYPILERQGMLYIAKSDFDNNIFPLLSPGRIPSAVPSLHRIVIDPGHGGNDPGTEVFPSSNRSSGPGKAIDNEKTHTLEVGLLLAEELRKRGYEVILTRTTDVNVDKPERTVLANKANADLYLSIHFNEAAQDYVNGTETWLLPPAGQPSSDLQPAATDKRVLPGNRFDAWNAIVGFSMERAITRDLGAVNRGVKRKHLIVLDGLNMPGLLVECGFLSNPAERAKIDTSAYRQKIALALADGIDLYKSTLDHLRPKPLAAPTAPAASAGATSRGIHTAGNHP